MGCKATILQVKFPMKHRLCALRNARLGIPAYPAGRYPRAFGNRRSSRRRTEWWARSDSNRGPRDSLDPAVSGGSGLSLHPL